MPVAIQNVTTSTGSGGGAAPPTRFEKAYLQLYEPSRDGTLSQPGGRLERVDFQFNPTHLTVAKSARWARATGTGNQSSGPPQYQGPEPSKLDLELFLDASATQDNSVVSKVELLLGCCVPTRSSHSQDRDSPPWVMFRWGGITSFLAYVSKVSAKYTMFSSGGLPIRAAVTLTLEELSGSTPGQNPTSGGLVPRRAHVMVEGDTLAALAYQEYGTAALWRKVAQVNGIDDPFRVRVGTTVLLPAAEELTGAPADREGAGRA
ncbi:MULTISPECIES: peptidase M23 [unclassified Pseudactinotalea]|uniref:CIS tube protein n=1 Tax=unclassified Pseudactinotalea TaxID=2649176 RepID=UPI00128BD89A|nr:MULTISPECIES: peptidase M23 [unclassified Pseudactinotalea]MPV48635.1 peptidase M23 [Pseudactinotalea sp. HY160]QGH68610.1 peptidase M23 [Pseudactinotalea sp. HY158]